MTWLVMPHHMYKLRDKSPSRACALVSERNMNQIIQSLFQMNMQKIADCSGGSNEISMLGFYDL